MPEEICFFFCLLVFIFYSAELFAISIPVITRIILFEIISMIERVC